MKIVSYCNDLAHVITNNLDQKDYIKWLILFSTFTHLKNNG